MPLSGALTSTLVLRGYKRAVNAAVKNKAAIADPVIQRILMGDAVIGRFVGHLLERTSLLDLGGSKPTANAEGAAPVAATAVTPVNIAPTPTRYEFARNLLDSERSQLAGLGMDDLPPDILDAFIQESFDIWANQVIYNLLYLAPTATYQLGTTSTALSWLALQNGYLESVNRGASQDGVVCALRLKGVKDVGSDVLSLGGAVQWADQVQQFLQIGKTGYIGEFFGGLRIYMLDDVQVSPPDDIGLFLGSRGAKTVHKIVPLPEGESQVLLQSGDQGWITVESKRDASTVAASRIETVFHTGAAISDVSDIAKVVYRTV